MAEAKRQHDWNVASTIMALMAEINRDRKRRRKPFKPDDFNIKQNGSKKATRYKSIYRWYELDRVAAEVNLCAPDSIRRKMHC